MKKIPETFRKNRFSYKILKRSDTVAIYEQKNKEGVVVGYETHKVRSRVFSPREFKQRDGSVKRYEGGKAECLACDEEFGVLGWFFECYGNALDKFEEINGWIYQKFL